MAAIFLQSDAQSLLKQKYVLLIGDSNTRAVYKDLLWLLQRGTLIDSSCLRRKLEYSFLGDKLIERSELHKGRNYKETRHFEMNNMKIHFQFITRCFNESIEQLLLSFKATRKYPDVIFFSSLFWDIMRWGPDGVNMYKENMVKLMDLIKSIIPPETLIIWGTTLPVSSDVRNGGFLIKQIEFMKHKMRFEVMEGNNFSSQLVKSYGYDVLDLHYYMRMQIHRRCNDGIHFMNSAVRHITNLTLTHIALSWDQKLPGNFICRQLQNVKQEDLKLQNSNSSNEIEALRNQLCVNKNSMKLRRIHTPTRAFPRQGNPIYRKIMKGRMRRRYNH